MVDREKYTRTEFISRDGSVIREVRRAHSGEWTLVLDVCVEAQLDDGRRIRFEREVLIRGRQSGAKPRGGFARKEKTDG
jgi:hypothetical protein